MYPEKITPLKFIALLALAGAVYSHPAHALDGKVYSPEVVKGEAEFEYAGTDTFDSSHDKNNAQEHQFSVGYGFTDFWKSEVYVATLERGPGEPTHFSGTEFENVFQFWPIGEYWIDAGLLASYHLSSQREAADSVEFKLLLQKDIGRFTSLVNAGFEREVGRAAGPGTDVAMAGNVRYRWLSYFQPGIEMQSDLGNWEDHNSFDRQAHYLGPIAYGEVIAGLKYEAGFFAGISQAASSSAARFKLEYEYHF